MKNKMIWTIILLVVIVIGILINFKFSTSEEDKIKKEIEQANYCNVKEDCVDVGGKCPFGCYTFVNKNEAERIRSLIQNYDSTCAYACLPLKDYNCINNKCIAETGF